MMVLNKGLLQSIEISERIVKRGSGEFNNVKGDSRVSVVIDLSVASFLTTCLAPRLCSGTKIRTSPLIRAAQASLYPSALSFASIHFSSSS